VLKVDGSGLRVEGWSFEAQSLLFACGLRVEGWGLRVEG